MTRKKPEINKSEKVINDIRQISYRDWDPMEIFSYGAEYKYDSCIGTVYQILSSSRSEKELIKVLL